MQPTVFIVDDEPMDQALLRQGFQRVGSDASIEVIPDPSVAIGMLDERTAPSLLIVDLRLGVESGIDVVRWVRDHPTLNVLPVLIISGSQDPADVQAAYKAGANAFIPKPSDLESLERLCREIDEFWLGSVRLPTPDDDA
ncbi:MAG: response regulator [Actinomycetota bacterium]